MKLTKADAARQLSISRTTLYKLIEQGRLSATPDGLIDQAELIRIAPTLDVHRARHSTRVDMTPMNASITTDEQYKRPVDRENGQCEQSPTARQLTSTLEAVVDILRGQLQAAQERETLLLRMLHESQQRYDRLIEAPRTVTPVVQPSGESTRRTVEAVAASPTLLGYNPDTHVLGSLCKRGHDWNSTGQSLRKKSNQRCLTCDAEWARARRRSRG